MRLRRTPILGIKTLIWLFNQNIINQLIPLFHIPRGSNMFIFKQLNLIILRCSEALHPYMLLLYHALSKKQQGGYILRNLIKYKPTSQIWQKNIRQTVSSVQNVPPLRVYFQLTTARCYPITRFGICENSCYELRIYICLLYIRQSWKINFAGQDYEKVVFKQRPHIKILAFYFSGVFTLVR